MSSAMPTTDLALSLLATRDLARERSDQPQDAYDELAEAAAALRGLITADNRSGGDHSNELRRDAFDDQTAEQLRANLTTLTHDRSEERARALTAALREHVERLSG